MEASEKELALATKMMDSICSMLEGDDLKFRRDDERLVVHLEFSGNDFPLQIIFKVFPKDQLVIIYSPLTFTIPESGRVEVILAMNEVNHRLIDGVWVLDSDTGEAQYRITNSYYDSILGKECLKGLMKTALSVNNDIADKFFMLGKGNMTLQQFCESVFGN